MGGRIQANYHRPGPNRPDWQYDFAGTQGLLPVNAVVGGPRNDKKILGFQMKYYYVYILSNKTNTVLYTGVTNDLKKRTYQHREKLVEGFTKKFNVSRLVYYEQTENVEGAIQREKQIKSWNRAKKVETVSKFNPKWEDLFEKL